MKARLHCKHCDKYYDVALKDVRLMQETNGEFMTFTHNTYYYDADKSCFFKTVSALKRDAQKSGVAV